MPPGSILIVGAGLAGARCAETLRAEGFEGELVLVGEEPFPPYERPALSKEFLAGERSLEDLLLRPESFWLDRRIDLALGERVVSIDSRAGTATTHRRTVIRWNALVLATGARPRRLPFPAPPGVHVLRTVAEASALRDELVPDRRLVVVGGGFVGAEVASTARALGLEVTMLEQGPAPFARLLGEELGALLVGEIPRTRSRRPHRHTCRGVQSRRERQASERRACGRQRGRVRCRGCGGRSRACPRAEFAKFPEANPRVRRRGGWARSLDERGRKRSRPRAPPPRPRAAATTAGVLLVGPIRVEDPARRRPDRSNRRRARRRSGQLRRSLPDGLG